MMTLRLAAVAATALALTAGSAFAGGGDRLIRRCTGVGAGDISMSARYEVKSGKRRFDVEFEAATPGAFKAGQTILFRVSSVRVGSDQLESVVGGDVVGEINLDSRASGEPGDDRKPFPSTFPTVGAGTLVTVVAGNRTVIGCRLR